MARKTQNLSSVRSKKTRKWSAAVMKRSDALDLEQGIFTQRSPSRIAASLKRSAMRSRRRKGTPFQSAMSMLTFHINRAGQSLSAVRRARLEKAKDALRKLFARTAAKKPTPRLRQTNTNSVDSRRRRS
jgi:hypothetical protein